MKKILNLKKICKDIFPLCTTENDIRLLGNLSPLIYFITVIVFYILFCLLMMPNFLLSGEMWAEMATNYYHNANAPSYTQKLLASDYGYIPALQRLVALIGNQLNFTAAWIPYFYTWSSILLTSVLVGVFCLPQFRRIVLSDSLRFFIAISLLLVVDFETRTFINFTYFITFFVSIVTALALVDDSNEVPWWAIFIPILMVSKPLVFSALPIMVLVALISRPRFRLIIFFTLIIFFAQYLPIFFSFLTQPASHVTIETSLVSSILTVIKYFFGTLGSFITGPSFHFEYSLLALFGLIFFSLCVYLIVLKRTSANALIVVGISLVLFNLFMNVFLMSETWSDDMSMLRKVFIHRYTIISFFGCIFIVCGAICSLKLNDFFLTRFVGGTNTVIFITWFVGVGWLEFSLNISKEPSYPTLHNSQWQLQAKSIDIGLSPLCVPIDPWWKKSSWMYSRNCNLLMPRPDWKEGSFQIQDSLVHQIKIPILLSDKTLVSAALLVKPIKTEKTFVEIVMRIQLKDGAEVDFKGSKNINSSGGLLLLVGKEPIPIKQFESVTLVFNTPVMTAVSAQDYDAIPGIVWMGY